LQLLPRKEKKMNPIGSTIDYGDGDSVPELLHSKTLESQPWSRLDFSRAKWYTLMYRHGAPKPIKFGRSARWVPAEVDAWIELMKKTGGAA
jgi:predicted DNA-binding transcriptional regulator AlpA